VTWPTPPGYGDAMGNIGREAAQYEVLPLEQTIPSPEPMPVPHPEPVPEPVPGPDPAPQPPSVG
jgi:hypothetical protein